MNSSDLDITGKLIGGCCQLATPALLMIPNSHKIIDVTFSQVENNQITLEMTKGSDRTLMAAGVGCVYFRYDNASRVILCRLIDVSASSEDAQQVVVEVLSDTVARDSRSEFRVRVRDHSGLRLRLTHDSTGTLEAKIRDISHTGCLVEIKRASITSWSIGEVVQVKIEFNKMSCHLEARIRRIGLLVGLELLDPESHTVPRSKELRIIVSELERKYLRTRIRV